ncbi:MAG TPA: cell wall metabolism sensor histidine kinase WalK [Ligilactobacillus acidipiscis]|uniref:histidine kinase n=1 Tax=Ligilactobacillus acidipiscis TaxID=89059 RepID=A0A921FA84_9LACO|nr:cell wall metabolism sensor histidine kinase WalK [Ligilactobacillus acidipiscis]
MRVRQVFNRLIAGGSAVLLTWSLYAKFAGKTLRKAADDLHLVWIILAVLLVILLILIVEYLERRRENNLLKLFTKKLEEVTQEQKTGHVLVDKQSELYDLGQAVNHVQSMTQSLFKDYNRQKRGYLGLLEYVPIGVMVIDQDREIYLSNHYLDDIMEHELDMVHELYYSALAEFDIVKTVEETFRTKQDQRAEIKVNLAEQTKILNVNVVFIPVSGHHFFVMLMIDDVTEQKQIERMQNDFVSNVSHELKTPVTSIAGFSETLKNGALEDPGAANKFVDIIYNQSLRLKDLINDILSLSRIGTNMEVNFKEVQFSQLVSDCALAYDSLLDERQVVVLNKVPAKMKVQADPGKLKYILSNLVQNAVRYNKIGGKITVTAKTLENKWQFQVSDTGIGMTSEQQGRIFERFYRADTSRSKEVDGTGLGLAIVKEYVEVLSGQIKVDSQLNIGTTFTVILPLISENN